MGSAWPAGLRVSRRSSRSLQGQLLWARPMPAAATEFHWDSREGRSVHDPKTTLVSGSFSHVAPLAQDLDFEDVAPISQIQKIN